MGSSPKTRSSSMKNLPVLFTTKKIPPPEILRRFTGIVVTERMVSGKRSGTSLARFRFKLEAFK